jgi:hypothetical protein
VGLAMKGSIGHVQLIIDRTDGKVTQALEVTGKDGGPVAHDFSLRLAEYAEVALAAVAEAAGSGDAAGDVPADGAGEPVHPAPAVQ